MPETPFYQGIAKYLTKVGGGIIKVRIKFDNLGRNVIEF